MVGDVLVVSADVSMAWCADDGSVLMSRFLGGVSLVSLWSRWYLVAFRECLGAVLVVFCWCFGGVPLVSRCLFAWWHGVVFFGWCPRWQLHDVQCLGGASVLLR